MRWLKVVLLHTVKLLGGFGLARYLTRGGLRIICWHGISRDEEHTFRPSLFITAPALRRRIAWLKNQGFPILGLDEAVRLLDAGRLPACATVLTFDDGWASWRSEGARITPSLPVTGYVMTCYLDRQEPVFNIFAQYAYWKSGKNSLRVSVGEVTYDELWTHARRLSLDERAALLPEIAEAAGVDLERIMRERWFGILNSTELRELGWDIQLHTHHHQWSDDEAQVAEEIRLNSMMLAPVAQTPLRHFCYPSGEFYQANFSQLSSLGIISATTCEPRFNWPGENPLALGRLLDAHNMPQIVFEARLCGVFELLRRPAIALGPLMRPLTSQNKRPEPSLRH